MPPNERDFLRITPYARSTPAQRVIVATTCATAPWRTADFSSTTLTTHEGSRPSTNAVLPPTDLSACGRYERRVAVHVLRARRRALLLQEGDDLRVLGAARALAARHEAREVERRAPVRVLRLERHAVLREQHHRRQVACAHAR